MLEKFLNFSAPNIIDSNNFSLGGINIPDEIVFLLKNYKKAVFLNGFFTTVNPSEFENILLSAYDPFKKPSICFAKDSFGSLYVWENESIKLINFRYGLSEIIGRKPSVFFNLKMTDEGFLKKRLKFDSFQKAKQKLGEISYDECYGYVPLLALGGHEKIENLQKVKIKEHIHLITELTGKVN